MAAIFFEALQRSGVALIFHVQPAGHRLTMPGALSFHRCLVCRLARGDVALRQYACRLYVGLLSVEHVQRGFPMAFPGAKVVVVEDEIQGSFAGCSVKTRFEDYGQRSGSERATRRCVDVRNKAQEGVARVAEVSGW